VPQNRKVAPAVAFALAVAACALAPPSALGKRLLHDPAPPVAASFTPAPVADADASADAAKDGDSAQSKHKEGGLARILAAPFRALSRLFGGAKKSQGEEAKRSAPTNRTPGAGAAQAAADAKQESADARRAKRPATAASPLGEAKAEAARPAETVEAKQGANAAAQDAGALAAAGGTQGVQQQGARIVRPSEAEASARTQRIWIPVIEGIPQDPLTQGRALLEHGYVQESIAELTVAAAQAGPGLVEANNLLGLAYDRMGWHTLAAEAYNRALTAAPKDANVLANLGYSLYLADDYEGALRRLKQAAKLAPGTPVINNSLAIVEARLQKYDAAFKHFAAASNEYDAHLKLASILEDQKRDREAIKHYEAALRIQPGTSAVLERLVALYERNGLHDKADQARRALGQPKNPQKTTTGGGG
jgi:tetratricopeptide (TPR) repeat protein